MSATKARKRRAGSPSATRVEVVVNCDTVENSEVSDMVRILAGLTAEANQEGRKAAENRWRMGRAQ